MQTSFKYGPLPYRQRCNRCTFSDDLIERENETLRERVVDLERRLHDQNDEVTCLRATLADALRRISSLEAGKGE